MKNELNEVYNGSDIINIAYTDYGGTFVGKCLIEYVSSQFPDSIIKENTSWSGENAFIFGEIANEIIKDDIFCFYDFGDFYCEKCYKEEEIAFRDFVNSNENIKDKDGAFDYLIENYSGYYFRIETTGLDFSESDLIQKLETAGFIN
ncbi:MAG: hypothetical protein GX896_06030 [Clostridiales bacterium]|nr:hypothetical protein [Clostridiales bacterium]